MFVDVVRLRGVRKDNLRKLLLSLPVHTSFLMATTIKKKKQQCLVLYFLPEPHPFHFLLRFPSLSNHGILEMENLIVLYFLIPCVPYPIPRRPAVRTYV